MDNNNLIKISPLQMEGLELLRTTTTLERNYIWKVIAGQNLAISDLDKDVLCDKELPS